MNVNDLLEDYNGVMCIQIIGDSPLGEIKREYSEVIAMPESVRHLEIKTWTVNQSEHTINITVNLN
jgi:hypothetical protein